jgi:hypothetical protein
VADHPQPADEHRRPARPLDEPGGDDDSGVAGRRGDGRGDPQHDQADDEDPAASAVVGEHAGREQADRQTDAHRAEHPREACGPGLQRGGGAHASGEGRDEGEEHEDRAAGDEAEHVPRSGLLGHHVAGW